MAKFLVQEILSYEVEAENLKECRHKAQNNNDYLRRETALSCQLTYEKLED